MLNGLGPSGDQPLSESSIRELIKAFEKVHQEAESEQDKKLVSQVITAGINSVAEVHDDTVRALGFLVISQKALLYSSSIISSHPANL